MTANSTKRSMPFSVMSDEADVDYLLARLINFLGLGFQHRAGYFAQMACEKYLKAITIQAEQSYAETHKLLDLAASCARHDPFFADAETKRVLEQFDMFDQVGRYGGAANFDPLSAGKPVGGFTVSATPGVHLAGVAIWTSKHLDDLDGFVFKTRSLLDYGKINWGDAFQQCLIGQGLFAQWKEILTRNNRYFRG